MTPFEFAIAVFAASIVGGVIGSLLGLGGGIVVVPVLTLFLGIPIPLAIGASLISVIATSSGSAATYLRDRITNIRVGTFLQLTACLGAVTGAWAAVVSPHQALFVIFGVVLAVSAIGMFRRRGAAVDSYVPADALADRLRLHSSYFDEALGTEVAYRVTHTKIGLALMYAAGVISGLLGIGAGVLKVPAMDIAMRLPIKVSTTTSNFIMGVTAASSAGVYFFRGDIDPFVAGPVALGVLTGSFAGSRMLGRIHSHTLRIGLVIVAVGVSIEMILKGVT